MHILERCSDGYRNYRSWLNRWLHSKGSQRKTNIEIVAMNRSEKSLIDAYNDGVIDKYSLTDMSIFKECDIIIVCTTVDTIPTYVSKLKPYIKKDCIITDVGSTKRKFVTHYQILKTSAL